MSGKEFPNNWQEVHDADPDQFDTCTFEEFMIGMSSWHIPSSHTCVMRVENTDTGKIKEFSYRTQRGTIQKLIKLVDDPANVITVADNESIHYLKYPGEDEDEST